jgi:MraZ protein
VVDQDTSALRLSPPQGHLQASVDDKGRLNTPGAASKYFEAHGITDFFCTTLDGRIALIYPLQVWLESIEKMAATPGKAASAKRLSFIGNANGAEVTADKNGRLLLPSNLRAKIGLEKQAVWLSFYSGHAKVMTKAVYEAELQSMQAHSAEDLAALEEAGLY